MKKLLIINTLPEDDPAVSSALEALGRGAEEVRTRDSHLREKSASLYRLQRLLACDTGSLCCEERL